MRGKTYPWVVQGEGIMSLRSVFAGILAASTFAVYLWPGGIASQSVGTVSFKDLFASYAAALTSSPGMTVIAPQGDPSDPHSYLADQKTGRVSQGPIMSLEGGTPVFLSTVFEDYRSPTKSDRPAKVIGYDLPADCFLSPRDASHYIGNVFVVRNENDAGLYADQPQMRTDPVFGHIAPLTRALAEGFGTVDIAITHTAEPVHLVLTSGANFTLWNLHAAPGVTIARVSLLSGGVNAFANLPEGVPIERVREGDSGDCHPERTYPWIVDPYLVPSFAGIDQGELRAAYLARERAYDRWFRAHFGIGAMDRRAGWDNVQAVLIGPVPAPDAKISYHPLSSATLMMPANRSLYTGPDWSSERLFAATFK